MNSVVVTIDGPAGAGKTTVSRRLAEALNYRYVDTGALYRAVAFAALAEGVSAEDDEGLARLCKNLLLEYRITGEGTRLFLNDVDITEKIRTPAVTMMASAASARPVVRAFLFDIQKQMGRDKAAVFEGRDMGTVVFPSAEVKFFLSAAPEIRALRRYNEQAPTGKQSFQMVEKDMTQRDKNDSNRAIAPLKPAKDAVHIDSSKMSVAEVVEKMRGVVEERLNA